MLLEVTTNWAHVGMVTVFGFLLVLFVLIMLIFVLQGFGALMQRLNAPKAPKAEAPKEAPKKEVVYAKDADGETKAAIAMALHLASSDAEMAAVAMALNLYYNNAHDVESYALTLKPHATVWNDKSYGINNLYR